MLPSDVIQILTKCIIHWDNKPGKGAKYIIGILEDYAVGVMEQGRMTWYTHIYYQRFYQVVNKDLWHIFG